MLNSPEMPLSFFIVRFVCAEKRIYKIKENPPYHIGGLRGFEAGRGERPKPGQADRFIEFSRKSQSHIPVNAMNVICIVSNMNLLDFNF
jgi:hypothetical protein